MYLSFQPRTEITRLFFLQLYRSEEDRLFLEGFAQAHGWSLRSHQHRYRGIDLSFSCDAFCSLELFGVVCSWGFRSAWDLSVLICWPRASLLLSTLPILRVALPWRVLSFCRCCNQDSLCSPPLQGSLQSLCLDTRLVHWICRASHTGQASIDTVRCMLSNKGISLCLSQPFLRRGFSSFTPLAVFPSSVFPLVPCPPSFLESSSTLLQSSWLLFVWASFVPRCRLCCSSLILTSSLVTRWWPHYDFGSASSQKMLLLFRPLLPEQSSSRGSTLEALVYV